MASEWREVALGDRCSVKSSKRIFAREYVKEGVPFMRSKDVIDKSLGLFSHYDLFISRERFSEISGRFGSPQRGDLLINSVGNRSGQPYVIQDEGDFYFKDGNILWLNEFDQIDADYLAYWFKSRFGQHALEAVMIGSAQKALTIDAIRKLVVKLPSIKLQRSISGILKSLDDRIELNHQMNETLEAMAQALFKSWFVDFDPVIDNALANGKEIPEELSEKAQARAALGDQRRPLPEEIRTLFPDEFTYSEELGWIPKGWKLRTVSSFVEKLSKGTTPRKKDIVTAQDDPTVPFLKVKDVDEKGNIKIETLELIPRSIHEGPLKRSKIKDGDVLFSIAGTIGRTTIVPIDLHDANVNQAIAFVRPKEANKTFFLLQLLRSENIQNLVRSRIVQAVQANVSLTELGNLPALDAGKPIANFLHENLSGIYKKVLHLQAGSAHLTKLRDTLLPKLLSGELRIPDAEKMIERAAG